MEWLLLILLFVSNLFWYNYAKYAPSIIHAKALAIRKVVNVTVTEKDNIFYFHDLVTNMFILQDTDYIRAVEKIKTLFSDSTIVISILAEKFDGKSV